MGGKRRKTGDALGPAQRHANDVAHELAVDEPTIALLGGGDRGSAQCRANGGLTDREQLFVAAYVDLHDLGAAAMVAGYGGPKATAGSMRVTGYRVRHKAAVAREIERLHKAIADQVVMTKYEAKVLLARNAYDAREVEQYAASTQAIKLLASEEHPGMFREGVEITGPGGGPIEVSATATLGKKLDALQQRLSPDREEPGGETSA